MHNITHTHTHTLTHTHTHTLTHTHTHTHREAEEAEESSRFSKLQVVQSVSKIAKEFGSIKKQVEIGKLTNLCVQLQEQQAEEDGSEGMGVARARKVC